MDYGGVLTIVPEFDDPVRQAKEIFKSRKVMSKVLLNERKKERKREAPR